MDPREILKRRLQQSAASTPARRVGETQSIIDAGRSALPNRITSIGGTVIDIKAKSEGSALVIKNGDAEFTGGRYSGRISLLVGSAIAHARGLFSSLTRSYDEGKEGFEIDFDGNPSSVEYRGLNHRAHIGAGAELGIAEYKGKASGHALNVSASVTADSSLSMHDLQFGPGSSGKVVSAAGTFSWES